MRGEHDIGGGDDSARDLGFKVAGLAPELTDLTLAQLSYEQGAGTSIELVDAERSARDAATNASTAQVVAELARVDLLVATGRWSQSQ